MAFDEKTNRPGVICPTCTPPERGLYLVHGKDFLLGFNPEYPVGQAKYKIAAHTVEAVSRVVRSMETPLEPWIAVVPPGIESALDVFAGYIFMDAWIANQDRHHENWAGVMNCQSSGISVNLAPSFDHGAALARNLSDLNREKRMTTNDLGYGIREYAKRAKSAFNASGNSARTLTTDEAWKAFAEQVPAAAIIWKERLHAVNGNAIRSVLDAVPADRMSETGKEFTFRLLWENRIRLLEES